MLSVKRESALTLFVAVSLAVFFSFDALEKPDTLDIKSSLSLFESTVTVVTFLSSIFIWRGWRLKLFREWLVVCPLLEGIWSGSITPIFLENGASEMSAPICSELRIKQNLFFISCVLSTSSMQSRSFSGQIIMDDDTQEKRLIYSYSTNPKLAERAKNPRHDGTASLLISENSQSLKGTYWTDRLTRGEIFLERLK